jgi:hypothetical protein
VREGLPGPEVWLVLRRNPLTGELKAYLSNAPAETAQMMLVRMSELRWPIETCFEDGKQYLGMGDYEVGSWCGWHHHMTLCIGSLLSGSDKPAVKKTAPGLTVPQVQVLLLGVLPKRDFDTQAVLELVAYWQQRNYAAYVSHRKRRITQLRQRTKLSL